MNSFDFVYPPSFGEDLIDEQAITGSPISIMMLIFGLSVFVFWFVGFLIKTIQS